MEDTAWYLLDKARPPLDEGSEDDVLPLRHGFNTIQSNRNGSRLTPGFLDQGLRHFQDESER